MNELVNESVNEHVNAHVNEIDPRCLKLYEEAIGTVEEIYPRGDCHTIVKIGTMYIILPPEVGEKLSSLIGQRIGILRMKTEYKLRVIAE